MEYEAEIINTIIYAQTSRQMAQSIFALFHCWNGLGWVKPTTPWNTNLLMVMSPTFLGDFAVHPQKRKRVIPDAGIWGRKTLGR
jgi:hypothetical protein